MVSSLQMWLTMDASGSWPITCFLLLRPNIRPNLMSMLLAVCFERKARFDKTAMPPSSVIVSHDVPIKHKSYPIWREESTNVVQTLTSTVGQHPLYVPSSVKYYLSHVDPYPQWWSSQLVVVEEA
jgi:hypothetical protein